MGECADGRHASPSDSHEAAAPWKKPCGQKAARPAVSGMLEVLILISLAVAGTSILAAWFATAHHLQLELECEAFLDTGRISTDRYWASAVLHNTGDHPIGQHSVVGARGVILSDVVPIPPGESRTVEFVATAADLPIVWILAVGHTGGTTLCEVRA